MERKYDTLLAAVDHLVAQAQQELAQRLLRENPEIKIVSRNDVLNTWIPRASINRETQMYLLLSTAHYPGGVFYERPDGVRGYRYGFEKNEYLGGFL